MTLKSWIKILKLKSECLKSVIKNVIKNQTFRIIKSKINLRIELYEKLKNWIKTRNLFYKRKFEKFK